MTRLTQERLTELAHYDPDTGIFTWRVSRQGGARAGEPFGNPDKDGYLQAKLDGVMHKLHRLAFLYMGEQVPPIVDHENRVRRDNSWKNLRQATKAQNAHNQKTRIDSGTKMKGVRFREKSGLYQAYIRLNNKYKHLGNFGSADEAAEFAQLARDMCHGEYVCHG
jgi:hypothetical protein